MSEQTTHIAPPRLERSGSDRMLAGVAGGLGAYFELHPAVFRVSFVVLTLMGGAGILIYLAAALVMPEEGREDSVATAALRRRRPWVLVVLGLAAVVPLALLSEVPVWPQGDAWPFLLIAGALALWLTWFAVAGGLLLLLGGLLARAGGGTDPLTWETLRPPRIVMIEGRLNVLVASLQLLAIAVFAFILLREARVGEAVLMVTGAASLWIVLGGPLGRVLAARGLERSRSGQIRRRQRP